LDKKPQTMKKILVPVDFSASTIDIMRFAAHTTQRANAQIIFFHSYYEQIVLQGMSGTDSVESLPLMDMRFSAEVRERAETQMKEILGKIEKEFKQENAKMPPYEWNVEGGDFETEIRMACNNFSPDLLILGSEGNGKKDPYSGSVAARLFKHAKVPVLAISKEMNPNSLEHILFLTDFSEVVNAKIRFLLDFALLFNAKIHCRHLHLDPDEIFDDIKTQSLEQSFSEEIDADLIDFKIIRCEDGEKGIQEVFKEFAPDIIAFLVQKHGFLHHLFHNTITRKDIFKTGKPLLVFSPQD